MDNQKVLVSRDVKFFPSVFPYSGCTNSTSHPNLPFPCFPTDDPILPTVVESLAKAETPTNNGSEEEVPPLNSSSPFSTHQQDDPTPGVVPETVLDLPRRSVKNRRPPQWLEDYVGNVAVTEVSLPSETGTTPPTYPYQVFSSFTKPYSTFLFNLESLQEPTSFKQACLSQDWTKAIDAELAALE